MKKGLTLKKKKGFTLIELIVVIAILAILAAIAVPNFIGMTQKANEATQIAAASEIANAININNTMYQGGDRPANAVLITAGTSVANVNASLAAYNILPTIDTTLAANTVYPRINIVSNVASVPDKGTVGGTDAAANQLGA